MALTVSQSAVLLAADPSLPHRDLLLDAALMHHELAAALDWEIDGCEIKRVKYRVAESLRVCYSLTVNSSTHLVALRCFASTADRRSLRRGKPDVIIRQLNAAGWVFPRDRKLTELERFWHDPKVQEHLLGATPDRLQLVSYAPEKAATIRVELPSADGPVVQFVKLVENGHRYMASRYVALAPYLASCGVDSPALVRVDDQLGAFVISEIKGSTLAASPTESNWAKCGMAAAALHTSVDDSVVRNLPAFGRLTPRTLHTAVHRILSVRPDLASDLSNLMSWLHHHTPSAESRNQVVAVHGDLHAKNVVIGSDRTGFIDLDQASQAPAAAEIGSAIAALRYTGVLNAGIGLGVQPNGPVQENPERAFLAGYDEWAQLPDSATLRWYVVAALVGERALRSVNRVRPTGLEFLPAVVDAAIDATEWSP